MAGLVLGVRHIIAKKVLVFPFGKRYVKFFWGGARGKFYTELRGNFAALSDSTWASMVVPVSRFGSMVLLTDRGLPLDSDNEVLNYLNLRLDSEFNSSYKCQASDVLDDSFLLDPCFMLERMQVNAVQDCLSLLWLPLSSAHGDLHKDNFIRLNGELKIIDWAMYKAESSFVLDYMHYFCRSFCAENKLSWVDAIWLPIAEWQALSLRYDISLELLRLAYAINKISLELAQDNYLFSKKLEKYRGLVLRLVDSVVG